jgi:hypothetical protein
MPNQFTGKVLNQDGTPVMSAKVKLYEGTKLQKESSTNKDGEYTITINTPITPANCKILIYKDDKEVRSITNPQPTGDIIIVNLQINRILGGVLDLQSQYKGGEYYFTSLGSTQPDPDLIRDEFDTNLSEVGYLIQAGLDRNIDIDIIITGSESKIPNTDNEEKTEDGKRANPNKGNSIPVLGLAKKRVQYLNKHIIDSIKPFDTASIGNYYNSHKKEEYIVSGEDYKQGDEKSKYTKYQYVRIKAIPKKPICGSIGVSAQNNDEYKLNYVSPESKWLVLSSLTIPDRFGFNNYLQPYYSIIPETANSEWEGSVQYEQFDLTALGLQIFFHLYLLNGQSSAFLDVETPGKKINYTPISYYGDTGDKKSKRYAIYKLSRQINPDLAKPNQTGPYNGTTHKFFLDVLKNYPGFFKDNDGKAILPNASHSVLISAIETKINELLDFKGGFKNAVKVGIIEVKREDTKIDITKPEYGLRVGEASIINPNVVNGISSIIDPDASQWLFCLCDDPQTCIKSFREE